MFHSQVGRVSGSVRAAAVCGGAAVDRLVMLPPPLQVGGLQAPSELQQFVAAVLVMRQVEAGSDGQRAQLVE